MKNTSKYLSKMNRIIFYYGQTHGRRQKRANCQHWNWLASVCKSPQLGHETIVGQLNLNGVHPSNDRHDRGSDHGWKAQPLTPFDRWRTIDVRLRPFCRPTVNGANQLAAIRKFGGARIVVGLNLGCHVLSGKGPFIVKKKNIWINHF